MSFSMEDLLCKLVDNDVEPNDQIYSYLCVTDISRLRCWMSRLERVRSFDAKTKADKGRKSKLIGEVFEKLIRCLFDGCHALECLNNVRSTTSEIDFLVGVRPLGAVLPFLKIAGTHLIGEAKCVSKGFKKEWVDELRGIMETHGTKKGILFTAVPPRKVTREPRNAIALHAAQGHLIVPFGKTQIEKIVGGENFLKVLARQSLSAQTHLELEV